MKKLLPLLLLFMLVQISAEKKTYTYVFPHFEEEWTSRPTQGKSVDIPISRKTLLVSANQRLLWIDVETGEIVKKKVFSDRLLGAFFTGQGEDWIAFYRDGSDIKAFIFTDKLQYEIKLCYYTKGAVYADYKDGLLNEITFLLFNAYGGEMVERAVVYSVNQKYKFNLVEGVSWSEIEFSDKYLSWIAGHNITVMKGDEVYANFIFNNPFLLTSGIKGFAGENFIDSKIKKTNLEAFDYKAAGYELKIENDDKSKLRINFKNFTGQTIISQSLVIPDSLFANDDLPESYFDSTNIYKIAGRFYIYYERAKETYMDLDSYYALLGENGLLFDRHSGSSNEIFSNSINSSICIREQIPGYNQNNDANTHNLILNAKKYVSFKAYETVFSINGRYMAYRNGNKFGIIDMATGVSVETNPVTRFISGWGVDDSGVITAADDVGKIFQILPKGKMLFTNYSIACEYMIPAVSTADRIRLRTDSNLDGKVIGFIDEGDDVFVTARSENKMKIGDMEAYWYKIVTPDGLIGWSYSTFIRIKKK